DRRSPADISARTANEEHDRASHTRKAGYPLRNTDGREKTCRGGSVLAYHPEPAAKHAPREPCGATNGEGRGPSKNTREGRGRLQHGRCEVRQGRHGRGSG
ncbi:unnamed protein product, partial [Ixodes pacificus]